jgi:hypothetical protein
MNFKLHKPSTIRKRGCICLYLNGGKSWKHCNFDLVMDFYSSYIKASAPNTKDAANTPPAALTSSPQQDKSRISESELSSFAKIESSLQAQLQQAHSSKSELAQKHANLQEQFNKLRITAQTLTQSRDASDEKLMLQNQMHADKLRLLEVSHNTLKERCRAMAHSAEQHRIANLQLEERHKSMTKDLEKLAGSGGHQLRQENHRLTALVSSKESDIHALQSALQTEVAVLKRSGAASMLKKDQEIASQIGAHQVEIQRLKQQFTDALNKKETEVISLRSKVDTHFKEARLLQSKLEATHSLLKAHPIDPCMNLKVRNVIQSSAEILDLAHAKGGAESTHECLCRVADALKDLTGQLDSQRKLSSAWINQIWSMGIRSCNI